MKTSRALRDAQRGAARNPGGQAPPCDQCRHRRVTAHAATAVVGRTQGEIGSVVCARVAQLTVSVPLMELWMLQWNL